PRYPDQIEAAGPDVAVVLHTDLAAALSGASVNPLGPGLLSSDVATDESAESGRALRLVFTGESWGGVYVILGVHDARPATSVSMRLKLPDDVAGLELKLEDAETNGRSVNAIEHVTGPEVDGWKTIRVPLAEFAGIDLSRVSKLGLWNPSDRSGTFVACELIVAEIGFD
ncbi:MAG: hypothetical protein GTO30_17440, partial [Acidobacteria bacterium]|nr:hypothetical protein [Acidobacteriota bacterium]NIM63351.1 hypothetical protein [Acidobacteriota bacterium]NIO60090.1 hypothetical protein [Acidobacteriota bacterium]NIQ86783.1 hypothetical protein [Acidobacteriota bacterium]NIT12122.1 hypothetical protein [Acidobacteriota bacterium]